MEVFLQTKKAIFKNECCQCFNEIRRSILFWCSWNFVTKLFIGIECYALCKVRLGRTSLDEQFSFLERSCTFFK